MSLTKYRARLLAAIISGRQHEPSKEDKRAWAAWDRAILWLWDHEYCSPNMGKMEATEEGRHRLTAYQERQPAARAEQRLEQRIYGQERNSSAAVKVRCVRVYPSHGTQVL